MPGEQYTMTELTAMSASELEVAKAAGFYKPSTSPTVAAEAPVKDPNAWKSGKRRERDFTCPSGQTCRLRPLDPQKLLEAGLLDQISRLEGLAADLVDQAEGAPPKARKMPSREDFRMLLEVLNALIPIAVVEPVVYPDGDDAPDDAIHVGDIDLEDRMAIMDESLKSLKSLDRFRHPR